MNVTPARPPAGGALAAFPAAQPLQRPGHVRERRRGLVEGVKGRPIALESLDAPPDGDEAAWDEDSLPLSRAALRGRPLLSRTLSTRSGRRAAARWGGGAATLAVLALVAACGPLGHLLSRSEPSSSPVAALDRKDASVRLASVPPMHAERFGGPETTGAFTAAPAAATSGFAFGARPDDAKVRTARLDLGGPGSPSWKQVAPRGAQSFKGLTDYVSFESAPFPYDGTNPAGRPFLNTEEGEARGHRTWRGRVLWEKDTFSDNRTLVHMPRGFDADSPGVIVVYFHGHRSNLKDIRQRQKVPEQVTASGANAALLAPQFAVDASDSSAGKFWQPGGFKRFLAEGAKQLARSYGDPAAEEKFAKMPVVIVAYSGGFLPAAWSLHKGGVANRVRGVVLLDAMYGEAEKYAAWIANSKSGFFINASTAYTRRRATDLESTLAARGVETATELKPSIGSGAFFLTTGPDANHNDYVTQAWTEYPIKDVLSRLPEYRRGAAEALVASAEPKPGRRNRTAAVTPR